MGIKRPGETRPRVAAALIRVALGKALWRAERFAEAARERAVGLSALNPIAGGQLGNTALADHLSEDRWAVALDYAQLGLWDEARDAVWDAVPIRIDRFAATVLNLLAGRHDDYRRLSAELSAEMRPEVWNAELLRCVLFKGSAVDPSLAVKMAEQRFDTAGYSKGWIDLNLGTAYYRAGRYADAIGHLSSVPATEFPRLVLAMAHHRLGHTKEARRSLREANLWYETYLNKALDSGTVVLPNWWHHAAACEILRREAGELIEGRAPPIHPLLRLHRGRAYAKLGEVARAEAEFAAVEARPGDPYTWLARGRLFERIGRPDRARSDFATVATLSSDDPHPWVVQGQYLAGLGRRSEADAAYTRAAELARGDVAPFLDSAWWAVGPYPEDRVLADHQPPEIDPDPSRPVASGSGPKDLSWQTVPTRTYGELDFGPIFGSQAQSVYAMNYVYSADNRVTTLLVGGNDAVRLWINGRLVHEDLQAYPAHAEPGKLTPVVVHLRKGRNVLLAKVNTVGNNFLLDVWSAEGSLERGLDFARIGLWHEAAEQLRTAGLDDLKTGVSVRHLERCFSQFLLLSGDKKGFDDHARSLVARYGSSTEPDESFTLLYAWLYSGRPVPDGDRLVRLAGQVSVNRGRSMYSVFELALALYRAGRFEDVLRTLEKPPQPDFVPGAMPLLAMTHHRLAHVEQARAWLAKATAWHDARTRRTLSSQDEFLVAEEWLQSHFEVLYREAERLIEDPTWTDRNRERLTALARENLKRADPATADLDLALRFQTREPRPRLARASILADLGRDREAEADLDTAVKLKPDDPLVRRRRALIHLGMGRPEKAAEDVVAAREATPVIWEWYTPKGLGMLSEMVRDDRVFAELIRRDSDPQRTWDARLYFDAGRRHRAEAVPEAGFVAGTQVTTPIHLMRTAILQAWARDRPAVRESCRRILATYGSIEGRTPYELHTVAISCLILPDLVDDLGPILRIADRILTANEAPWGHDIYLVVRPLADLRARKPAAAVARPDKVALTSDDPWVQSGRLTLALARSRIGREAQARRDLQMASESIRRFRPRIDLGQHYEGNGWEGWLIAETLLH